MTEQRISERQFGHFLKPTEAVKATVPIMEVAPRYVDLQRQGGNYLGLCPFHQERTPSFYIYTDTNRFYCFGCQESGDVLDLHRRCGNFGTLWEAVVALAVEFDVELPRRSDRWHRWADEKGSRRHMAEEALTRSYQRRYFKVFSEHLEMIEDPEERESEAAQFFEDLYPLARCAASYRVRGDDNG